MNGGVTPLKRSELFKQAYCQEEKRGYFCFSRDGEVLWLNDAASQALPMLTEGQSVAVVSPDFDMKNPGDTRLVTLTGGYSMRVSRFEESGPDGCFYIAEIIRDSVADERTPDYLALLAAQIRDRIGRIRTFITETHSGLSDIQADYSGNVPRLVSELDHQLMWIHGAEKDCDALMRCALQAEESIVPRDVDEQTDAAEVLPALLQDTEVYLKKNLIPLNISCDWSGLKGEVFIGCSKEKLALAFLGMLRTAAVSAAIKEGNQLTLQAWNDEDMLTVRLHDSITDPSQLEAYEPMPGRYGQQVPVPANFFAARLRYLVESVEGSWMVGRTPGDTGYTMNVRFPLVKEEQSVCGCSVAYDLQAGIDVRVPSSGCQDMIRLMFSALEDDMR